MTKTAESKEETCEECPHCAPHTHEIKIADWSYEVVTGLFTCCDPESGHYCHVFTKGHRMPCVKTRVIT